MPPKNGMPCVRAVCVLCCVLVQAQTQPIRLLLLGPAGSMVRHDFRQASMCVVQLRLLVRNCCALDARLHIEVRGERSLCGLNNNVHLRRSPHLCSRLYMPVATH